VALYFQRLKRKFSLFEQLLKASSCDEKSFSRCKRRSITISNEGWLIGLDFMQQLNLFLDIIKINELVASESLSVIFYVLHQFSTVWRCVQPMFVWDFFFYNLRFLVGPLMRFGEAWFLSAPWFSTWVVKRKALLYLVDDLLVFIIGRCGKLLDLFTACLKGSEKRLC